MTDARRPLWVWILPAVALAAVGLTAGVRSRPEPTVPPRAPAAPVQAPAAPEPLPVLAAAPPPPRPRAASMEESEREVEPVLLETGYRNFRYAVATDNQPLCEALRPGLLRHRKAVLKLAQEDYDLAQSPADRDISARTLDALRR